MSSWERRRHVEVYPTNGRAGIPGLLPTKLDEAAWRNDLRSPQRSAQDKRKERKGADKRPVFALGCVLRLTNSRKHEVDSREFEV